MIERIDYRINELIERRNIERGEATEEVIMLRSISREQAKKEIMELLDKSDKLYFSKNAYCRGSVPTTPKTLYGFNYISSSPL